MARQRYKHRYWIDPKGSVYKIPKHQTLYDWIIAYSEDHHKGHAKLKSKADAMRHGWIAIGDDYMISVVGIEPFIYKHNSPAINAAKKLVLKCYKPDDLLHVGRYWPMHQLPVALWVQMGIVKYDANGLEKAIARIVCNKYKLKIVEKGKYIKYLKVKETEKKDKAHKTS